MSPLYFCILLLAFVIPLNFGIRCAIGIGPSFEVGVECGNSSCIKMDYPNGMAVRSCGSKCVEQYDARVSCCSTDGCNSAPALSDVWWGLLLCMMCLFL